MRKLAISFIKPKRINRDHRSSNSEFVRNVLRRLASVTVLLATVVITVPADSADQFPTKPITILVGSPTGNLSDVLARFIVQKAPFPLKEHNPCPNSPCARNFCSAWSPCSRCHCW
ncbi:TPA: hypothetical protein QDB16_006503 [Burkholderia vietnamiensis]|uniref:hypothetical protein n=1 Tax=Cupriavidus nantongensis TaxID=1796606 RepID=UPI0022456A38|nr:hypothetical protein [Cupriavidus nantongensis]HDR9319879.1 hypothetical protein [Burkholderia vietnamiensis]